MIELLGVAFAMASIWLMSDKFARKRKYGFAIGLIASVTFVIFYILNQHWWLMCYSLFRVGMSLRGIHNNKGQAPIEFMECSECSNKTGTHVLCPSCAYNRWAISKLQEK